MNKLSESVIHKELDLIQNCINRMTKNSFMIKGWMITLVSVIVALLIENISIWVISLLSLGVIFCFWYLDGFYLKTEELYRKKYACVIVKRFENNDKYLFDLNPYNKDMWLKKDEDTPSVFKCMVTKSLIPFYGMPVLATLSVIALKIMKVL
jgi:hypothetical protein